MEAIVNSINQMIQSGGWLAFLGAFLGGLLTAMNPCVLIMIPLIMGFIGGIKDGVTTKKAFLYSLLLVFGFAVQLALLFTVMSAIAPFFKGAWMNYVIAAICILMGLHFLEVFQIRLPISQDKLPKYTGVIGALLFGFLFGFISLPCTGPALLLIVSFIPLKGNLFGGILMLCYGLGHCALIVVVGTSIGAARGLIESKGAQTTVNIIKKIAALLLILLGIYFLYRA